MRPILAIISFLFIFSSCTDNPNKDIEAYKIAYEGFQQSNAWVNSNSRLLYKSLEEQLKQNETKVQASEWQPKAEEIKRLTDSMIEFIQDVKQDLRSEAGENIITKNEDWMGKPVITRHVFESHSKGKELYEKLISYGKNIINVDEKLKMKFRLGIQLFSNGFDYKANDDDSFTKKYFTDMPVIGALMLLSRFENNVRIIENQAVTLCSYQIGDDRIRESYGFLVGQSSNCLRVGEILEVTAGMGAYTTAPNPKLRFNNKAVPINEDGQATYKLKVPTKPGNYNVIIRGEFTAENGNLVPIYKTISYTVVE